MPKKKPRSPNSISDASFPPCPNCGGPRSKNQGDSLDRWCHHCRSADGKFAELSRTIHECRVGARKTDDLYNVPFWPEISEYACKVLGHPAFTPETLDRLEAWLLAEHISDGCIAERREQMQRLPLAKVVELLKAAERSTTKWREDKESGTGGTTLQHKPANNRPRKGIGGRKRLSEARTKERNELLTEWDRAKGAGVQQKQFCQYKRISIKELERAIAWKAQNKRRGRTP